LCLLKLQNASEEGRCKGCQGSGEGTSSRPSLMDAFMYVYVLSEGNGIHHLCHVLVIANLHTVKHQHPNRACVGAIAGHATAAWRVLWLRSCIIPWRLCSTVLRAPRPLYRHVPTSCFGEHMWNVHAKSVSIRELNGPNVRRAAAVRCDGAAAPRIPVYRRWRRRPLA
jgi:hypothetical protein